MQIKFSNKAFKFLKNCNDNFYKRIINGVKKLAENPYPPDSRKIEGQKEKVFRVRVGDYRILYEVYAGDGLLHIINIDKRGRVYK